MTSSTRDCFFTSIALNYLPKALVLADSVFGVYPSARMVIALLDHRWLSESQLAALDALVRQFAKREARLEFLDPLALYERPDLFRYKFNVVEACTSVKPAVALLLLETAQTVTYLDPDTRLYSPLPSHPDAADDWTVQLTPHVLAPAGSEAVISERLFMFYGAFNLGYFAVRHSAQTTAFLSWWKAFCVDFGMDAPQAGLFVDQKPIDLLPCFVDKTSVLRHPGCNMAWWNIFCDGRQLEEDGCTVRFANESSALVFFHFSNLDPERDPAKRLVSKPLGLYTDGGQRSRYMADQPSLERLYAAYEAEITPWHVALEGLRTPAALVGRPHDAPRNARLLLAEALRRGMQYTGDPFDQPARQVTWESFKYVLRKLTRHDVKAALSAILSMARLGLASRVLGHGNRAFR